MLGDATDVRAINEANTDPEGQGLVVLGDDTDVRAINEANTDLEGQGLVILANDTVMVDQ